MQLTVAPGPSTYRSHPRVPDLDSEADPSQTRPPCFLLWPLLSDPFLSTNAWIGRRGEQSAAREHGGACLISAPNKPVSTFPPPSLLHRSPKPAWPRLCPWGLCTLCSRAHSPHRVLRQTGGCQFPTGH